MESLKSTRNTVILARTVFATEPRAGKGLREALAAVVMNRYAYELDLDPEIGFEAVATNRELFPCWKYPRLLEGCEDDRRYAECFEIAMRSMQSILPDATSASIRFCRLGEAPLWSVGLSPVFVLDGYGFYNNCD